MLVSFDELRAVCKRWQVVQVGIALDYLKRCTSLEDAERVMGNLAKTEPRLWERSCTTTAGLMSPTTSRPARRN